MTPHSASIHSETIDRLEVRVHADRAALGAAAGADAGDELRRRLSEQPRVRAIFAAAPSQDHTLAALARADGIDWSRVEAFHMDEYLGLPHGSPRSFSRYLCRHLFDKVRPGAVHLIDSSASAAVEVGRYAELLAAAPIDIVCLGIGENGHIAFNDPPVADFHDPAPIKVVELDEACRRQQVNDGCFLDFASVPTRAITLTIPTLMAGARLFCSVPGASKRPAVARALRGPISTECPATILRTHPACTLYLDRDSHTAAGV